MLRNSEIHVQDGPTQWSPAGLIEFRLSRRRSSRFRTNTTKPTFLPFPHHLHPNLLCTPHFQFTSLNRFSLFSWPNTASIALTIRIVSPRAMPPDLAAGRLTPPPTCKAATPPPFPDVCAVAVAAAPRSGAIALTRHNVSMSLKSSSRERDFENFGGRQANARPRRIQQRVSKLICKAFLSSLTSRREAAPSPWHDVSPSGERVLGIYGNFFLTSPPPRRLLYVSPSREREGSLHRRLKVVFKLFLFRCAAFTITTTPSNQNLILCVRRATLPTSQEIFFPLRGALRHHYHQPRNENSSFRVPASDVLRWIVSSGRRPSSPSASFNISSHFQVSQSSCAVNSHLLADSDDFKTSLFIADLEFRRASVEGAINGAGNGLRKGPKIKFFSPVVE
ncbi:hypothetical protein R3P38DRAFT_2782850 [Favolaschia claudopus]|uniref:Uncharacterized protein n=1 Tax=Favolaschia claudopus TaxID=2862362 RepID=A0AAW0B2D1_9AGAR